MSHYIILTAPHALNLSEITYRVRADRIDWMADRRKPFYHTVVSINGTELQVEEPVHIILTYIKDPYALLKSEQDFGWSRDTSFLDYEKKYGEKEGNRRYLRDFHIPHKGSWPIFSRMWAFLLSYLPFCRSFRS